MLGVHSSGDDPTDLRDSVEEHGLPYPVVVANEATEEAYGITGYPTALLIGRDGRILVNADLRGPDAEKHVTDALR